MVEDREEDMGTYFLTFLKAVRTYWWQLVLFVFAMEALGYALAMQQPIRYGGTMTLRITPGYVSDEAVVALASETGVVRRKLLAPGLVSVSFKAYKGNLEADAKDFLGRFTAVAIAILPDYDARRDRILAQLNDQAQLLANVPEGDKALLVVSLNGLLSDLHRTLELQAGLPGMVKLVGGVNGTVIPRPVMRYGLGLGLLGLLLGMAAAYVLYGLRDVPLAPASGPQSAKRRGAHGHD